jgi:hypothetical protein
METSKEKEQPITWGMVANTVSLSKLKLRSIALAFGLRPNSDYEPSNMLIMRVLVVDLLEKLTFLTPEERELIADETRGAQEIAASNAADAKIAQIAFVDGQYILWTGSTGFFNIKTCENIRHLPNKPIETISYNLNELYRRGVNQIRKRSGLDAKRQTADGNVEESADFRNSPADGVP